MRVLILGCDGYIGYPLMQHLLSRDHEVFGVDDLSRRMRVKQVGKNSLTPISNGHERDKALTATFGDKYLGSITAQSATLGSVTPNFLLSGLREVKPDAIVHLAEQPSAPYSMIDPFKASETQRLNVIGTLHLLWAMQNACPDAHLLKLGTMGEYGTPNCDIPEGRIPKRCLDNDIFDTLIHQESVGGQKIKSCPMSDLLFPRTAGSFYHLSKVMDTLNIEFCCRNWGLRSTDIMQGVVFGLALDSTDVPNELLTRFDYDEYFGTAINRFCAQAISDYPLTVYGKGEQTRGFLPLKDSIQCLTLALENPPAQGEYRNLNQFENIYSINQLANMVVDVSRKLGFCSRLEHIPNPRKEAEEHYYNPEHQKLFDMGYVPTTDIKQEIEKLIKLIAPFHERVDTSVFAPKTKWE